MPKIHYALGACGEFDADSKEEAVLAPLAQTALLLPLQLSSEMSHSTGERVPGDTLRQLIEEHDQIQEFKRFVRERYGLVQTHWDNH
jgi:hypothetical protein